MKLPLIITTGMLTAAIAYNAYALTCGAPPLWPWLGMVIPDPLLSLYSPHEMEFNSSYSSILKKEKIYIYIISVPPPRKNALFGYYTYNHRRWMASSGISRT